MQTLFNIAKLLKKVDFIGGIRRRCIFIKGECIMKNTKKSLFSKVVGGILCGVIGLTSF